MTITGKTTQNIPTLEHDPVMGEKTNQPALFLWLIDNATVVCLGGGEAI